MAVLPSLPPELPVLQSLAERSCGQREKYDSHRDMLTRINVLPTRARSGSDCTDPDEVWSLPRSVSVGPFCGNLRLAVQYQSKRTLFF